MTNVLLLGAGNIGATICALLGSRPEQFRLTVADANPASLAKLKESGVDTVPLDCTDSDALVTLMKGHFAVLNALPHRFSAVVAEGALEAGIHYLDLTEDVAATYRIREIAAEADKAFIPQCGLAPGYIGILGYEMTRHFDSLDALRLRVGALPQYPANALTYNLTWSTEGVINEYCQPCEVLVNGKRSTAPPLEEIERFTMHGVQFEAFNTSGGLGTLCETLEGKVKRLNYRTIRYPGHRDVMKTLIHDLRLGERPELFKEVLEYAIPATKQDVIVIFVTATGQQEGRLMQESHAQRIYPVRHRGQTWTAIQITTASSVCAVLTLLIEGRIAQRGFVKQEEIPFQAFLDTPFGAIFKVKDDIVETSHV